MVLTWTDSKILGKIQCIISFWLSRFFCFFVQFHILIKSIYQTTTTSNIWSCFFLAGESLILHNTLSIWLWLNLCIYFISLLSKFLSWRGVLDSILCDKVCQSLATGRWFCPGTPVSSTNKIDRHDIAEILLKVALNIINQTKPINKI